MIDGKVFFLTMMCFVLIGAVLVNYKIYDYGLMLLAVGMIGAAALGGIARNPEATSKIQTNMILAIAFAEALGIYALVIALIIKFT